jgi:prepilin-type N-terminal cleavage/methylation domain-containing protein
MDRSKIQRRFKGFTLLELAVVVAVITLLLGSLLVPLATQVEQRNVAQTQKQLDDVREALLGFVIVNGRLPRPTPSEADGNERAAACADARECTGYLPWVTLGVAKTDVWGKVIVYSVAPQYANGTFTFDTPGSLKTVQTRLADGTLANMATNLVVVYGSHGAKNWGKSENGTDIIDSSTTNLDEDANNGKFHCTVVANCTDFVSRPLTAATAAPGGEFDDQLAWVPQSILLSRMVAAGKLP